MTGSNFGPVTFQDGVPRVSTKVLGVPVEDFVKGLADAKRIPAIQKQAIIDKNTAKLGAFSTLESGLGALRGIVDQLRAPSILSTTVDVFKQKNAFVTATGTVNPNQLLSVTTTRDADIGKFNVKVQQVATSDQVTTRGKLSDSTSVITNTGTLSINGQNISLTAGQSLKSVADSINARSADTKVRASIVRLSDNDFRLLINATETGKAISLSGDSSILTDLDFVRPQFSQNFNSTTTTAITNDADDLTITANGVTTVIDLMNGDTLQQVADKINLQSGTTRIGAEIYQLANGQAKLLLKPTNDNISFTTSGGGATALGLTAGKFDEQLSAKLEFNGLTAVRSTNTINDFIRGVTFDLFQANPGSTITVSVENDLASVKGTIATFVEKFNDVQKFIASQQVLDETGNASKEAVLFGNGALRNVDLQLANFVATGAIGVATGVGKVTTFGDIGLSVNAADGTLSVNDTRLDEALLKNFDQVRSVFAFDSTSTNSDFTVLGRPDTLTSDIAGQDIFVTTRGAAKETDTATSASPINLASLTVGGTLSLTASPNKSFLSGQQLTIADSANSGRFIKGTIASYDAVSGAISFAIDAITNPGNSATSLTNFSLTRAADVTVRVNTSATTATSTSSVVLSNSRGSATSASPLNFNSLSAGDSFSLNVGASDNYFVGQKIKITGNDPQSFLIATVTAQGGVGGPINVTIDKKILGTTPPTAATALNLTSVARVTANLGKGFKAGDAIELAETNNEAARNLQGSVLSYDGTNGDLLVEVNSTKGNGATISSLQVRGASPASFNDGIIRVTDGALKGFAFGYTGTAILNGQPTSTITRVTQGAADQIFNFLNTTLDTTGLLATEKNTLTGRNSQIQTQIKSIERSIEDFRRRELARFIAADQQIQAINSAVQSLKLFSNSNNDDN
jgi:flagellar capping protein FliD